MQQKNISVLAIAYELFTVLLGFINIYLMYDMLYNINEYINTRRCSDLQAKNNRTDNTIMFRGSDELSEAFPVL